MSDNIRCTSERSNPARLQFLGRILSMVTCVGLLGVFTATQAYADTYDIPDISQYHSVPAASYTDRQIVTFKAPAPFNITCSGTLVSVHCKGDIPKAVDDDTQDHPACREAMVFSNVGMMATIKPPRLSMLCASLSFGNTAPKVLPLGSKIDIGTITCAVTATPTNRLICKHGKSGFVITEHQSWVA